MTALPDPQVPPTNIAAERKRLAAFVGNRENAPLLFKPRLTHSDVELCGQAVLQHIGFPGGTNVAASDFNRMSDADVAEWGMRCWANTLAHLCETDAQVRAAIQKHQTYLPNDSKALELLIEKVRGAFVVFAWIIASPVRPLDMNESCYVKFIVLSDVILLENIQAKHAGINGGWGLLDKTIAGLREVAEAFGIRRIKAVATNERVYAAFLKRGFRDQQRVDGFERHVEKFARPIELILG